MSHLLERVERLKEFSKEELEILSEEIRKKIIDVISKNGGHLSSNLGIVELTIAIHYVFNSPRDKLIFDTSHQTYPHKLLTGRYKVFDSLRTLGGISGFSAPDESLHDHFITGHAGCAFSTALGVSRARDFKNDKNYIIPILGDASFTCGLTFEALNNIPKNLKNFIAILNDNKMAISKNVGNIKHILSRFINSPTSNKLYQEFIKIVEKAPFGETLAAQGQRIKESLKNLVSPAAFFEHFGLSYIGPIDGHDIKKLIDTLEASKKIEGATIIHVLTKKGKGVDEAYKDPTKYHGVTSLESKKDPRPTFPKIFGKELTYLAKKDEKIVAITPAMLAGSSLLEFQEKFPDRIFDVGIAESHALCFSGGLAYDKNLTVFVFIYSTFLQRGFDNIFHDIALQNLPVTIAIDRAGLSGAYGSTHHGIYDIGFLNSLPNLIITQPRNGDLLKDLVKSSLIWKRPLAIRYPNLRTDETRDSRVLEVGKAEVLKEGRDLLIVALGHMSDIADEVYNNLKDMGILASLVDPIFIKPLDEELFLKLCSSHKYVITIEEHALMSGFGSIFNSFLLRNGLKNDILNFGISDRFKEHGKNSELLKSEGIDSKNITKKIIERFQLKREVFV